MSGRRIELSATQVLASMLAAVTGAIAASYTGIAGTVIGVAVMSVASTAGAAVYKHYLARSQEKLHASTEKLRAAAVVIVPRSTHVTHNGAGHQNRPGAGGPAREQAERAQATRGLASVSGEPAAAEAASVAARPVLAAGQVGWLLSPDSPGTDEFPAVIGETTRWSNSPAETTKPAESPEPATTPESARPAEPAKRAGLHSGWRRWPGLLAAALGIFVLTLGGITAFEVAAGKPLEALIWGRSGGGTTVGVITGAQHTGPATRAKPQPAAPSSKPTVQPSPSPSAASSQSPSPSPTPSPTPTPTASSGSPSPSGTASPGQ